MVDDFVVYIYFFWVVQRVPVKDIPQTDSNPVRQIQQFESTLETQQS